MENPIAITENKVMKKIKPLQFWLGVSLGIIVGLLIVPPKNISVRVIINANQRKKE